MVEFYLNGNEQSNGNHEVHRATCFWLPAPDNRIYLGRFSDSFAAVFQARLTNPAWRINGCAHCCPESHTS